MDIEFLGRLILHPFLDEVIFCRKKRTPLNSVFAIMKPQRILKKGKDWKEVLNEIYLMIIERLEEAGFKIENIAFLPYEEWSKWIE